MSCHQSNRLSVVAFGVSAGILWGLGLLIVGLVGSYYDYGHSFIDMMGSIYPGYKATWCGSFIGGAWAFVDGLVAGGVFAFVHNLVQKCCKKCCPKSLRASDEQGE